MKRAKLSLSRKATTESLPLTGWAFLWPIAMAQTNLEKTMHYRNGREAKNGDRIVQLLGGKIVASGVLIDAVPGNDYCNGSLVVTQPVPTSCACICDCLHVDDLAEILAEKGLDKRPAGK